MPARLSLSHLFGRLLSFCGVQCDTIEPEVRGQSAAWAAFARLRAYRDWLDAEVAHTAWVESELLAELACASEKVPLQKGQVHTRWTKANVQKTAPQGQCHIRAV